MDRGAPLTKGEVLGTADLLRRLVDNLPAMLAYWDAELRCRFANRAYETWFGVKPQDLVGRHVSELLGPLYEQNRPHIEGALRGEEQFFEREMPDPRGGPTRHSQAHYVPDVLEGRVRGFFVMVSDITAHKQIETELRLAKARAEELANHDPLTGLPNRVLLEDRIARALEIARRRRHPMAVLFIDMDGFKQINDQFGHAAGDAVLVAVAGRIAATLRRADSVARLGGDEFVVVLHEVGSAEDALAVANKIRIAASAEPIPVGDGVVAVRFSVGISVFPVHGITSRELLIRADQALYLAKDRGRGRCAVFEGQTPPR
jgi:diguanylate cyclase (GGDEF)-like protein/PAS domain S-box-containing protein